MRKNIIALAAITALFLSCKKSSNVNIAAPNYDAPNSWTYEYIIDTSLVNQGVYASPNNSIFLITGTTDTLKVEWVYIGGTKYKAYIDTTGQMGVKVGSNYALAISEVNMCYIKYPNDTLTRF